MPLWRPECGVLIRVDVAHSEGCVQNDARSPRLQAHSCRLYGIDSWTFDHYRQMTTPAKLPVNDEDCKESEDIGESVSGKGCVSKAVPSTPSRRTVLSSGGRRLSTVLEREPDQADTQTGPDSCSDGPRKGSEWAGSSFSLCSDKFRNSSSHFSFDDSSQPNTGDDCAGLLLACLHCRFHELMVLLPDTCERAVVRCFPSYRYVMASAERDQQGDDCCKCQLELDCSFCGSCQDVGELIELAMEMSEMCYR